MAPTLEILIFSFTVVIILVVVLALIISPTIFANKVTKSTLLEKNESFPLQTRFHKNFEYSIKYVFTYIIMIITLCFLLSEVENIKRFTESKSSTITKANKTKSVKAKIVIPKRKAEPKKNTVKVNKPITKAEK